jgi:hypothetical protein
MTGERSLEERVAALEELAAHPLRSVTMPEFTGEDAEKFRHDIEAAGLAAHEYTILPPGPRLTEDEVRHLLRECVTVVKPGELLVIRVADFTPQQLREYNDLVSCWLDGYAPGVRCLITLGEELGVAEAAAGA